MINSKKHLSAPLGLLRSRRHSFAALDVSLQPDQRQTPAVRVRLRGFGVARESGMRKFKGSAAFMRLELPKNLGGVRQPT